MTTNQSKVTKRGMRTKEVVIVGMLGAISAILMLFEFYVPIAPPFIMMDFSELPIILGGFILGPAVGTAIVVIKILLNFVLNGTITAGIGELANFALSMCYMLPSVLIYRKLKSKKGAVISLAIGTIIASIASVILNTYLTFPAYAAAFKMPIEAIVAMGTQINPAINDMFTLMLFSILPFNLFKYSVASVITFLVYKRVSIFLRYIINE